MQLNQTSVFLDLIDLVPSGPAGAFLGPPAPERGGRLYGGQLLAQGVAAAYRTVGPERRVHSLHAYFLRPGDVDQPTTWEVETVRDGRSFAARSLIASQDRGEMFRMTVSFQTPEDGLDYDGGGPQLALSALPAPSDVEMSYVDFCETHPDLEAGTWFGQDRPMDIRYINPPDAAEGVPIVEPQLTWTRINEALPADDHVTRDAGLAYLADATLVDHALLPHGHRWHDQRLTGASLDHAMWFQRPSPADSWLLYEQRVESTSGARGLATGRFYTEDGQLVATCTQEGLIRWDG